MDCYSELKEEYWKPIVIEDDVLGTMVLDKAKGIFVGNAVFAGCRVAILAMADWEKKNTWKKPLDTAKAFIKNMPVKDLEARQYVSEGIFDDEDITSELEEFCREIGVDFIDRAEKLRDFLEGKIKYIFVEPGGRSTIGYEDGGLFGGHEIDVYVDAEGAFDGWDLVG